MRKKIYCFLICFGAALLAKAQTVPGELIVQLAADRAIEKVGFPEGLSLQRALSRKANIHLLSYDSGRWSASDAIDAAYHQPKVLLAQPNHQLQLRDTLPTDPLLPNQWQWRNQSAQNSLPDADVDAEMAWSLPTHGATTAHGDTIVVAIIDDGVQADHPDLAPSLWRNHQEIPNNQIDDDQNGYIDDYRGWNPALGSDHIHQGHHGTPVAGMIGAAWHNGTGGTGVAPHIKMMVVAGGSQTEAEAIEAYDYVLNQRLLYNDTQGEKGAFVVATNTSWGVNGLHPAEAPVWCQFYDQLGEAGILNCAATANANWDIDEVGDMPTACSSPYLIAVTASNRMDERTGAFGPATIDFAAPGEEVFTTQPGSEYGWSSGTSFASPIAAGTVGLLYSSACPDLATLALNDPAAAALHTKSILLQNVDPLPNMSGQTLTGGRLNAYQSLQNLALLCGSCPPATGLSATAIDNHQLSVTWNASDTALPTTLRWRAIGTAVWQNFPNAASPTTLEQLSPCTYYEIQVVTQCPDNSTETSPLVTATTTGCCLPPATLTAASVGNTEAFLQWEPLEGTALFNIHIQDETGWVINTSHSGSSIQLSGLSPCTAYKAYISAACQGSSSDSTTLRFVTEGCGNCTDFDYCPSYGGTSGTEWIEALSFGSHHHHSGLNEGTPLFPEPGFEAVKGQVVTVEVHPGFQHIAFPEYIRIWIDWNQDGYFDPEAERLLDTLFIPDQDSLRTELLIPADALSGTTRMRVSLKWAGFGSMRPMPCEPNIHFGEVEDYCVDIQEHPALSSAKEGRLTDERLRVWPNPFGDQVKLQLSAPGGEALIQLFGIDGRRYQEQTLTIRAGQPVSLDSPRELPAGWYLLQVRIADKVYRMPLVHH